MRLEWVAANAKINDFVFPIPGNHVVQQDIRSLLTAASRASRMMKREFQKVGIKNSFGEKHQKSRPGPSRQRERNLSKLRYKKINFYGKTFFTKIIF